jgi:hypothetical protein
MMKCRARDTHESKCREKKEPVTELGNPCLLKWSPGTIPYERITNPLSITGSIEDIFSF